MAEPVDPRASTILAGSPAGRGRTAVDESDSLIGTEVIGQYTIRKKLGAGGMGAVYLADQNTVGRPAVIKVLHPESSHDELLRSRFEIEARAASQLNHPNIVTIYNYGEIANGTLFLAMEYIRGESLEQRITKGLMPAARAAAVVDAIADALGEAHRRGVIHRDVKPSNVMLTSRGQESDFVKVLDFGVARLEGTERTATGMISGTPKYMSPEQLRGEKIDGRADLYSLGIVLYELIAGRAPFISETPIGYVHQHANVRPPRPSEVATKARIPASLDVFLERALAKAPDDRPPTSEAFREELKRAMAQAAAPAIEAAAPSASDGAVRSARLAKPESVGVTRRNQVRSALGRFVGWLSYGSRVLIAKARPPRKPLVERVLTRLGVRPRRPWYRQPRWTVAGCLALVALVALVWLAMAARSDDAPREQLRAIDHPKPTRTEAVPAR